MNTFSHLRIGKILLSHIKDKYGVELRRSSFLYGSILPDIKKTFKKMPHKRDYWNIYLKSEMHKLTRYKQQDRSFGRTYSRRLGVICHFYADFLCYPHTKEFDGSTYQHMKYEWELNRFLRKNDAELFATDFSRITYAGMDAGSIYGDFESLHDDYAEGRDCFSRDILYTLQACTGAVTMVTAESIVEPEQVPLIGGTLLAAAKL